MSGQNIVLATIGDYLTEYGHHGDRRGQIRDLVTVLRNNTRIVAACEPLNLAGARVVGVDLHGCRSGVTRRVVGRRSWCAGGIARRCCRRWTAPLALLGGVVRMSALLANRRRIRS
ncbi:hypothetical protein OHB12_04650 [Nocardia sp. NBC_01730]|uniref:hypothetical protein n=1 Tax=Nocardia sp. NBC_01730 TaxID=2975998 RepID=UPI002E0DE69D|nr:hypothetical protein OHB12_04650 [Nocardia sp. NBC_01730]